jgi:hypothetical protein
MNIRLFPTLLLFVFATAPVFAQLTNPPCDPLSYYNASGQEVVYRHAVPTPWFAVRMTAEWVATIDTAIIGMGVERASTSGSKPDTLEIRVLAYPLTPYFILDQMTLLVPPNLQGLVPDAMFVVEFIIASPIAWVDPPNDFYLAWRIKGPNGDIARLLMAKPAQDPTRSVIINPNSTTVLATDFMRTQLQLGSTDSVDFRAKVHACWPYGYPVELTSFSGHHQDGVVHLDWQTATEENNSGFIIERLASTSDKGLVNIWQRIGFVEGHGSTNLMQQYFFTDGSPNAAADRDGIVRYRLRQVDYDGRTDVSPVVEVTVPREFTFALDQVYPNPVQLGAATASVAFTLPVDQAARLELFDALGRSVAVLADGDFRAGRTVLDIPLAGLRSGVYFCRLISNGESLVRRISVAE